MKLTCRSLAQTLAKLAIRPLRHLSYKLTPSLAVNVQRLVRSLQHFIDSDLTVQEAIDIGIREDRTVMIPHPGSTEKIKDGIKDSKGCVMFNWDAMNGIIIIPPPS